MNNPHDPECICYGNWRAIVNEVNINELLDRKFYCKYDHKHYHLFGIVYGSDDYYYGMICDEDHKLVLASCVGSLETHGYRLVKENENEAV